MPSEEERDQDKKYLDISFGEVTGYGFGLSAPWFIVYYAGNVLSGASFVGVWLVMMVPSIVVLKVKNSPRLVKTVAKSLLMSCISFLVFFVVERTNQQACHSSAA